MARLPRLAVDGQAHHVLLRGHNAQPVFIDDDDRASLLAMTREQAAAERVSVHGYALLSNEIQFLLTPRQASGLSRFVQVLARRHGARFNRRHRREGTLWSGRFRASVVDPDGWVLRCLHYIETAAERAGEPDAAGRWSSRPHHLGERRDALIEEHSTYWRQGNTPFEREAAWRSRLERALTSRELSMIRGASDRGWVLGGELFLTTVGAVVQRPLRPRPAGRPTRSVPV